MKERRYKSKSEKKFILKTLKTSLPTIKGGKDDRQHFTGIAYTKTTTTTH
jgi:hypothetical protein